MYASLSDSQFMPTNDYAPGGYGRHAIIVECGVRDKEWASSRRKYCMGACLLVPNSRQEKGYVPHSTGESDWARNQF